MTTPELLMIGGALAAFTTLSVAGYLRQHTQAEKEAYIMNWGNLVKQILPIALSLVPGLPPVVATSIVGTVIQVESLPGKTGAQKKAIVMDAAITQLQNVNTLKGHDVVDVNAIATALDSGIDAGVNAVNAIAKSKALNVAAAPASSPEPKATGSASNG